MEKARIFLIAIAKHDRKLGTYVRLKCFGVENAAEEKESGL